MPGGIPAGPKDRDACRQEKCRRHGKCCHVHQPPSLSLSRDCHKLPRQTRRVAEFGERSFAPLRLWKRPLLINSFEPIFEMGPQLARDFLPVLCAQVQQSPDSRAR